MLRRYDRGHHRNQTGRGPGRSQPLRLDDHGVPSLRDHHDPHRRQAVGHLRQEAPVPHRSRTVRHRIRPRRTVHQHGDVHRMPRHPGNRRRYPHPRRHRGRRGPVLPPREGQDAGYPRCHLRCRKRNRTPHRRVHRGRHQLALVLLHQHPPGAHRIHPHHQEVPHSRQRRREAHRRQGNRVPVPAASGHPAPDRVRR